MKIEWNRVTWYSKLIAVVVFVLTFLIAYYLGQLVGGAMQYNSDIISAVTLKSSTSSFQNAVSSTDLCADAKTQLDLNICSSQEYKNSDAVLNELYNNSIIQNKANSFSTATNNDFIVAEQKWIVYRDAQCQAESDIYSGGSIQPLEENKCLETLTKQRIDYLKNYSSFNSTH